MATHSSILDWKIPWTEAAGKGQFTELQKSRTWLKRLSIAQNKAKFTTSDLLNFNCACEFGGIPLGGAHLVSSGYADHNLYLHSLYLSPFLLGRDKVASFPVSPLPPSPAVHL